MTGTTLAPLPPDPVRSSHEEVLEAADWRDRGSGTDMVTRLWHSRCGDFGAFTRFGLGWGPIEVVRAGRYKLNAGADGVCHPRDHRATPYPEDDHVRVLNLLVAGEPRLTIHVAAEGAVNVLRHDDPTAVTTPAPAVPVTADGDVTVPAATYATLRRLCREIQDDLTPERRRKKYFTKDTLAALDEINRLVVAHAGAID